MAVDTAQKRFSMASFGSSEPWAFMFEPDATVDLDDRQHLLGLYSGVVITAPAGIDSPGITFQVPDTRLFFRVPDNRLQFRFEDVGADGADPSYTQAYGDEYTDDYQ